MFIYYPTLVGQVVRPRKELISNSPYKAYVSLRMLVSENFPKGFVWYLTFRCPRNINQIGTNVDGRLD